MYPDRKASKADQKMFAPTLEIDHFLPRHPANINLAVASDRKDFFAFEYLYFVL